MKKESLKKTPVLNMPPVWLSLIPILVVMVSLGLSVFMFDAQPHISLILGALAAGIAAYAHGYSWEHIQDGFVRSIKRAVPSLLILLIIGMIIGAWVASGVVPAMMYYGFKILHPLWFLPLMLIFSSAMALITGSSWTTVGTIGLAALGIGNALGINDAIIAGCVVSGAFFGDKISPMSDSTNLTPSTLGVGLYDHIKHMISSTAVSYTITLVAYTIIGFVVTDSGSVMEGVARYQTVLTDNFAFSPLLWIPPVAVIALVLKKVPAIPSLLTGVFLGAVVLVVVQGHSVAEVFQILHEGFSISTGWREMDELLSTGGMVSMYSVVALGILALVFGGIMHRCNMLKSIVSKLHSLIGKPGNLVAVTVVTAFFINIFGANQYLAVIIPGQMFETPYSKLNLKLNNLTRALEAGGTLTAPLIPWNSSGAFMLSVLAVSPLAFAPYAIFCWLTPIIVVIFGYGNIKMDYGSHKPNGDSSAS